MFQTRRPRCHMCGETARPCACRKQMDVYQAQIILLEAKLERMEHFRKHDCIQPIAYKVRRRNDGVEYGPFDTLQEANVWVGTGGHNELIPIYPAGGM